MIIIERTKKGKSATWERGGYYKGFGNAIIICDKDGNPKVPICLKNRCDIIPCGDHALIPVELSDIIIRGIYLEYYGKYCKDWYIEVAEIIRFCWTTDKKNPMEYADLKILAKFENKKWDNQEVAERYNNAIKAAKEKSICSFCRSAHYIKEMKNEGWVFIKGWNGKYHYFKDGISLCKKYTIEENSMPFVEKIFENYFYCKKCLNKLEETEGGKYENKRDLGRV